MSAFIRRQPGAVGARTAVDLGTRPGLHGQVLISTGLAGLDRLLGGGLPLGTILLLLEDSNCQQHINFVKCFMAEGVNCKHSVAWLHAQQLTPEATAAFLPDLARSASSSTTQVPQPAISSTVSPASAAASSNAAPDDGLKIAWQYRKYIQQQQRADALDSSLSRTSTSSAQQSSSRSSSSSASSAAKNVAAGIGREWCRQYDLTKGLSPAQLAGVKFQTCCCQQSEDSTTAVVVAGAAAGAFVQRFQPVGPIPVPSRDPASIGRLVIQSLGSPAWWPDCSSANSNSSNAMAHLEASMLSMLADLRLQLQDATCAALVTCPASLFSEPFQARLQHLADAVLVVQCLADNTDVYRLLPDPTTASALLEVRRLPHLGLLRQRYTEDKLYLIRHKRRSISISVLDLLPLEAVEQQAAGSAGAQKDVPAVAKICGSGPGKQNSVVDF